MPLLSLKRLLVVRSARFASQVELTAKRHPELTRNPEFATVDDGDRQFFQSVLGRNAVLTDRSDVEPFNCDWIRNYRGLSQVVLKPESTDQIAKVLSYCWAKRLAVVPQGGNTGLVGGSVPVFDEIVLNMSRMNKVISFDKLTGVVTAEAGCILGKLEDLAADNGYTMPIDLGAKGSCQIGGNISTSAGGLRFLRYGSLHGYLRGIEVVLADGQILNGLNSLAKDNTGLHWPHLFVGSEGSLGVVTKVSLSCPVKMASSIVTFLGVKDFPSCLQVLMTAKRMVGEVLNSCEFIDAAAMECVVENAELKHPFDGVGYPFYILIEVAGSNATHDEEKVDSFLQTLTEQGHIENGIVATEGQQMQKLWALRERITEALQHDGYTYKNDISLPTADFYRLVEVTKERVGNLARRVVGYGHLGDGNIHLNVTSTEYSEELNQRLYPFVYEWTAQHGGSISAEHGIGLAKRKYLKLLGKPPATLQLMRNLKNQFDPRGILNPYKVIP